MKAPLRQALLLALAALAGGQAAASVPDPMAIAPLPIPLPILEPLVEAPAHGATGPTAAQSGIAPATPMPAFTDGATVFARLRRDLNPKDCEAGSNSARWRGRYAGSPAAFSRRLQSVLPLLDFVSVEVERSGLPAEFTFIPLVESWYQPGAVGPGGPAGMWQMIGSTARNHGIHIQDGYDGRLSPVESTRAALSYLRVLKDMFGGDWQAIVMAYNAGEGRMQQAMRRAGSRVTSAADRRPHGLSNITYDYVAKLQALSCLVAQPQRFGLHLPVETRFEPLVPLLMDPGIQSLEAFARAHGKDPAELRRLNPGFRGGRVVAGVPRLVLSPPGASAPVPSAPPVIEVANAPAPSAAPQVPRLIDAALPVDFAAAPEATVVAVPAPGTVASAVATAFDETVAIVEAPRADEVAVAMPVAATPDPVPPSHEVRNGESLWSIAHHYRLPIEQLRRANGLRQNATVHPGQVLKLVP